MSGNGRWKWIEEQLAQMKSHSLYRRLQDSTPDNEPGWIVRNGQRLLNMSSNHYLGLEQDINLRAVASDSKAVLRTGATASRLIVGNDPLFTKLEQQFASFKRTEDCLLFSNGYMANIGTISSLVGRGDIVYSDRLNHASITDGIVLSRAEHIRYRHRDMNHLEHMLQQAEYGRKKLIVTDTIFSMDGSIAPLREMVELKDKYNAILMVDEAHSGGIYGADGEGLVHELDLTDRVDVHMGTFSKAYGCYGAYVAGDTLLKSYLVNRARSFIYTTALPSMVISAIYRNWRTAVEEGWRRSDLLAKSEWFRRQLHASGLNTGGSECHIVPLLIGDNAMALRFSDRLREEGIAAVAIRPPTVPEGTARIRFTLMATHPMDDLRQAIQIITAIGQELGLV